MQGRSDLGFKEKDDGCPGQRLNDGQQWVCFAVYDTLMEEVQGHD